MTQARLVGGRYELGELIGYGGMAEVHRGRDIRLGREVAIKVLRADLARDPSFLNRFRREAQAAAGLNHPSIVSVYDTGDGVADALPYIVMEYVQGRTLRDVVKSEGRLPIRRAMEIVADVCGALDFSHRNGIVHRDIKPANVMITEAGAVKVMDFGIARALADNSATVTQTASVIGTAQYLSPEQARGELVDARSDVYSTGCLLYELVTGAPPFQGDSPVAVAYQHVRETAMAPSGRNPEVPPAVDSIVMKALAKNQLNRYQTAGEMRTDLQRALANQPVSAESVMSDADRTQFIARTPPPPVAVVHRDNDYRGEPDQRRSSLVWLAVVVALLLVIGAATYAIFVLGKTTTAKTYAVPAIVGQLPGPAADALTKAHLRPVKGDDTNGRCVDGATVAKGKVCVVDPAPGTKLKDGSTVTYQLYTPATVQVPLVVGLQANAAVTALHKVGLKATQRPTDDPAPAGQVVKQSQEQFASVAPGTTIVLSVSTGKVKLIDVTGKKQGDAKTALNTAGWANVNDTQTTVTHILRKDGTVASMNPLPGIAYPQSQQINLVIFKYSAPTPTCTSVPPTTPTDTATATATGIPTGTPTTSTGGLPPCGTA
ncbi:MAG: Stk1 family PASTA domain-containing Ser/Thr kinase [Pseudonocardiales bacterium]|nr:MAG: Stk1 family PASTA domain-containing Ser/Thr kinase [Pseudonocardiales bacterium]